MRSIKQAVLRRLRDQTIPQHAALPFMPKAPVIVEAGAHIGTETVELAELWPQGTIHAFEPIPAVYEQLVARIAGLSNVRVYNAASTGTSTMWVSEGGDQSSSLSAPKTHLDAYPDIRFDSQTVVQVTTLDVWAAQERVDRSTSCGWRCRVTSLSRSSMGRRFVAREGDGHRGLRRGAL